MNYYLLNTDSNTSFKKQTADLKNEELIWLKSYCYFLEKYVQSEFKVKQITKELKDVPLTSANNKTKTHDVKFTKDDYEDTFLQVEASNLFSPMAKEFLLYVYLNQIAKSESHKLSEYVTIFKRYSNDPELLESFEKAFLVNEEKLKKVTNEVVLWDRNKNKTTLEEVLLKNRGKVIYIDFWASWCGPCRAAFPASRELHKKFPEVVFLYLSTDANFEAWKKANAFEQLEANSYLILNNKTSEYLLSLKIDFIPRYLIIDSNGVLVNANAPGANTDTIAVELKKYLSN
jgi:thiol-disulfide isomerase/thioredoxin